VTRFHEGGSRGSVVVRPNGLDAHQPSYLTVAALDRRGYIRNQSLIVALLTVVPRGGDRSDCPTLLHSTGIFSSSACIASICSGVMLGMNFDNAASGNPVIAPDRGVDLGRYLSNIAFAAGFC
jgi:hypothetical protein